MGISNLLPLVREAGGLTRAGVCQQECVPVHLYVFFSKLFIAFFYAPGTVLGAGVGKADTARSRPGGEYLPFSKETK